MSTRWIPESEEQLGAAVRDHILAEDHCTDFKEQLKEGSSGNKELAKDLASFSADGGC